MTSLKKKKERKKNWGCSSAGKAKAQCPAPAPQQQRLDRCRKEQNFRVILTYKASLRPAWATQTLSHPYKKQKGRKFNSVFLFKYKSRQYQGNICISWVLMKSSVLQVVTTSLINHSTRSRVSAEQQSLKQQNLCCWDVSSWSWLLLTTCILSMGPWYQNEGTDSCKVVLWLPHMYSGMFIPTHTLSTHKITQINVHL